MRKQYSTMRNYPNNKFRLFLTILIIICFSISGKSQEQEPKILKGKIEASASVKNIHVINLNLEKGTTTDDNGSFNIIARENDSIYFSSLQYEKRTIRVTSEMMKNGSLTLQLSEQMNELAEVFIDDIKLSGYLAADISQISMKDYEMKSKLQANLGEAIRLDRELNPVIDPTPGIKLDKLVGLAINTLKKPGKAQIDDSPKALANKSLEMIGYKFFKTDLRLNDTEITNFLNFCSTDARFKHLVINENTLALIEYLQTRIHEFRETRGNLLNQTREIPG